MIRGAAGGAVVGLIAAGVVLLTALGLGIVVHAVVGAFLYGWNV